MYCAEEKSIITTVEIVEEVRAAFVHVLELLIQKREISKEQANDYFRELLKNPDLVQMVFAHLESYNSDVHFSGISLTTDEIELLTSNDSSNFTSRKLHSTTLLFI